MLKNSSKLLFLFSLIMGSIISISSNSWFGVWMGLEINLLSFIPLMIDTNNSMSTEATLKYFLTQAIASASLLFSMIIFMQLNYLTFMLYTSSSMYLNFLIMSTLLLKSGAAPFHFWLPNVMEGLNWLNNLILMTWQKIAPLMIISYLTVNNPLLIFIIILSVMIGSIGGLSQTSLKKIMAFSSINHLGWMLSAMINSENIWFIYFLIYCFLSLTLIFIFHSFKLFHINQSFSNFYYSPLTIFVMLLSLLSLGGLPPFLGFLPKWLVIQSMINNSLIFTTIIMVCLTLLTLFYYLQICYSIFMFNNWKNKWHYNSNYLNFNMKLSMLFSFFSIFGLILLNMIIFFN